MDDTHSILYLAPPRLDFHDNGVWVSIFFNDDTCTVVPALSRPTPPPCGEPLASCEWTPAHHELLADAILMWRSAKPST